MAFVHLLKSISMQKKSDFYFLSLVALWSIQGGLATAFDLAAFRLSMIAPVKKSVNHPKTVASMRGTGWKKSSS